MTSKKFREVEVNCAHVDVRNFAFDLFGIQLHLFAISFNLDS